MGLKEDVDVAHYKFPVSIFITYDGNAVADANIGVTLVNADGKELHSAVQDMALTPTQKANLKTVIDNRIAALESATGWTDINA